MKNIDLHSLEKAFSEALSMTEESQRQEYLQKLADLHPELAAEVRNLLEVEPHSSDFFEAPRHERMRLLMTTLGNNLTLAENDLSEFLASAQPPQNSNELARLDHQFALTELVACGATGFVFRGWDQQLDRQVAIKVLAPSISKEPKYRSAFISEARFASQINHPNVVTIYHVASGNSENRNVFFVMEWIEGAPLQLHLEPDSRLLPLDVPSTLTQISMGVSAIHKKGIVHRDLKPGNILIESDSGRAVIIDFGLAFESSVADAQLLPAGTPLFMSPEQIMGQRLTDRSDQFSLAIVAFQMLTGHHPFTGESIDELLENIRQANHSVNHSGDRLSEPAKAVFQKALSASTSNRFESVSAFFIELQNSCPELKTSQPAGVNANAAAHSHLPETRATWSPLQRTSVAMSAAIVLTTLGYLGLKSTMSAGNSKPDAESASKSLPISSDTANSREHRWIDENTMINFMGIEFVKLPAPADFVDPDQYPPFPEHPEYTERFDWRYFTKPLDLISKYPITYQQYFDVMGKFPQTDRNLAPPSDLNAPVSQIHWRDARKFCDEMSLQEGNKGTYSLPLIETWAFAAYGQAMLEAPESAEQIEAEIFSFDSPDAMSSRISKIQRPFGGLWELTLKAKPTYQTLEGLVSLSDWGRRRNTEEYVLVGGGNEEFFVHWFDLNNGCNDYFFSSENLTPYTETDRMTSYLRPTEIGKTGSVTYRYQADNPITSALIQPSMFLHNETDQCGIQIRARKSDSASALEDLPWTDVISNKGLYLNQIPTDITPFVFGLDEFEIRYWVRAYSEPLHYAQIFRGVLWSTRDDWATNCFVRWTVQREKPSVRPTGPIPQHYGDPRVTFRVTASVSKPGDG